MQRSAEEPSERFMPCFTTPHSLGGRREARGRKPGQAERPLPLIPSPPPKEPFQEGWSPPLKPAGHVPRAHPSKTWAIWSWLRIRQEW